MTSPITPRARTPSTAEPRHPRRRGQRSALTTIVVAEYLFAPDDVRSDGFDPSPVVDFNELVGRQDYEVCERVQRGVASRAFTSGYLTDKDRYVAEFVHHYRTTLAAHT